MSRWSALALCGAGWLAACNVGPDYSPPKVVLPTSYSENTGAMPSIAQADLSKWWTVFGDRELDSLIARALKSNLDLESAASRVRQAREQEIIAGAAEWPSLGANGAGLNLHSNSSPLGQLGSGGSGRAPPVTPTNIKLYSLGFDATWEIDLFGGTRRAVEAAEANTQAALWQMHDAEVMLTAEIANDYLDLRAAQERIRLLRSELADQSQLLLLVRARAKAGFVTQLDVNQQKTLVSNLAAQIPDIDAQASAREHALGVLLAATPESMAEELQKPGPTPPVSPALPTTLPSDLLRRRPDIRAAERKLAAATAQEGVATADLYPKFDLIGAASFTGSRLSNLLSASNFGTVGVASVMWPIFEAGKIRANIRASEEAELQAYFSYRKTVLGALQDTEDALARLRDDTQAVNALAQTQSSASSSETIARQQYAHGLVTYINVLTAEMALFSASDQLVQARASEARDYGSLYKALGGGWDETTLDWSARPASPQTP